MAIQIILILITLIIKQTICNMKNLKYLSLAGCSLITANGITCLVRLPQLQELELVGVTRSAESVDLRATYALTFALLFRRRRTVRT